MTLASDLARMRLLADDPHRRGWEHRDEPCGDGTCATYTEFFKEHGETLASLLASRECYYADEPDYCSLARLRGKETRCSRSSSTAS